MYWRFQNGFKILGGNCPVCLPWLRIWTSRLKCPFSGSIENVSLKRNVRHCKRSDKKNCGRKFEQLWTEWCWTWKKMFCSVYKNKSAKNGKKLKVWEVYFSFSNPVLELVSAETKIKYMVKFCAGASINAGGKNLGSTAFFSKQMFIPQKWIFQIFLQCILL